MTAASSERSCLGGDLLLERDLGREGGPAMALVLRGSTAFVGVAPAGGSSFATLGCAAASSARRRHSRPTRFSSCSNTDSAACSSSCGLNHKTASCLAGPNEIRLGAVPGPSSTAATVGTENAKNRGKSFGSETQAHGTSSVALPAAPLLTPASTSSAWLRRMLCRLQVATTSSSRRQSQAKEQFWSTVTSWPRRFIFSETCCPELVTSLMSATRNVLYNGSSDVAESKCCTSCQSNTRSLGLSKTSGGWSCRAALRRLRMSGA
mmetsp:Transcript_114995/g.228887  ORF Transcript_114995/g.228887 Transcript_114995/m.228887 type:complete len:264 (-) Transcript_114995:807-1598(-)